MNIMVTAKWLWSWFDGGTLLLIQVGTMACCNHCHLTGETQQAVHSKHGFLQ